MNHRRIVVSVQSQKAFLYEGASLIRTYTVSTGKNGTGCVAGSNCTPTGLLRIAQKIGDGLPLGAELKGRVPTGRVWSSSPDNPLADSQEDLILTRILWLEGCEPHNFNTFGRYIYFHGTNQENLLGTPASHGCIRMSNTDMIELFELVDVGTEVEILP